MSDAYDRALRQLALDVASELGYSEFLREGVYCVLGGPSFETIAECRMMHSLGADAVGECPISFSHIDITEIYPENQGSIKHSGHHRNRSTGACAHILLINTTPKS